MLNVYNFVVKEQITFKSWASWKYKCTNVNIIGNMWWSFDWLIRVLVRLFKTLLKLSDTNLLIKTSYISADIKIMEHVIKITTTQNYRTGKKLCFIHIKYTILIQCYFKIAPVTVFGFFIRFCPHLHLRQGSLSLNLLTIKYEI